MFSPTDLNTYVECEHLLQLELRARRGEIDRPDARSERADLVAAKGDAHERDYLADLRAQGLSVVTIDKDLPFDAAAEATLAAMRSGADIIYQATFVDGEWRGRADFLRRAGGRSALGAWSYEVEDTKLARKPKAYFLLQLCFYSEQVSRLQERAPERMHVVLGTRERVSFRYEDFNAYYRRLRSRFLEAVEAGPATSPYPVSHCALCDFTPHCEEQWRRDDHLSLIPFMRRDHVEALEATGIRTVAALAASTGTVDGVGSAALAAHRHHAALQIRARRSGRYLFDLLPPEPDRGLQRLPPPSSGDVFFDMEGDPFFEAGRGLEYLFGLTTVDGDSPRFRAVWAHDRCQEKQAFEQVVDFIVDRRRRWPDLHVYHYAPYETAALGRLMGTHGTHEEALDDLLRHDVFVDLYPIVRQAMRTSLPGYSIKQVRTFFMAAASGTVLDAGDSIVAYERWCETRDERELHAIAAYNEQDCLSNLRLRDWLCDLRSEASRRFGVEIPWKEPPSPPGPGDDTVERRGRREELVGAIALQSVAPGEATARWTLLSNLLHYHQREAKPEWWAYFDRLEATDEELLDNADAISGLEPTGEREQECRSTIHGFRFPPQEHKLSSGEVHDPKTKQRAGDLITVDDREGLLRLKRGPSLSAIDLPTAIVSRGPIETGAQEEALLRVAAAAVRTGIGTLAPYRALADILNRRPPRIQGVAAGARVQTIDLDVLGQHVRNLDDSYVFVQGPPGSGKTWIGARLIVHLIDRGFRIGVTAQSHKVIHNLLGEVEKVAAAERVGFRGLKKCSNGDEDTRFAGRFIESSSKSADFDCPSAEVKLLAGTAWLFARASMDQSVDFLFIDEAGQISLADALAVGTAARNIVLLGDPLQLAQVSTGSHPPGAAVSVLEHLLGSRATVGESDGVFLEESWRMHRAVCRFISDTIYDGRLRSALPCDQQQILCAGWPGAGIRFRPADHTGNSQRSIEEADLIAAEVAELLGDGLFSDRHGHTRRLAPEDVLVVAAYNQQVRYLRGRLPDGVRVGTVDKFQGQQAPVVFFSMACSSADDIPRGLEFLFSRNRLNVAVSRAQCIATVVASPRLLDAPCRTPEQMRLVNALCRLAEYATASRSASAIIPDTWSSAERRLKGC